MEVTETISESETVGISILVPTRGRPANMTRLVESAFTRAAYPETIEVIFYIDDDDHESVDEARRLNVHLFERFAGTMSGAPIKYVKGPRIVLSEMWNECARQAYFDVMMHCGDDIVFQTDRWDSVVLSTFSKYPDRIVLVHGRDGYQDERLATHSFLHRNWVNITGYFVPPYFVSDYNDTWLTEVADKLGRRAYVPELYTEHMHPVIGKGPLDKTHEERLARHQQSDPAAIYAAKSAERDDDVAKLREFIERMAEVLP